MPMKATKVTRLVKEGKGKIRYDRKLKVHYLQLLVAPSGVAVQKITLGIDPGSTFDGFSVVSKESHHLNIELIQRAKKGKTSIKTFKARQAMYRKIRRYRLRHRRVRFDNRTKDKLPPTIRANVEFRQWLITKLLKIYPISNVVVEDVKFNHYKNRNGSAFSKVEQGKNMFYDFLRSKGLLLELYYGYNTKKLRVNSFKTDKKAKAKDEKSFEAHCLDSYVLACDKETVAVVDLDTGEITEQFRITNTTQINKKVIFIEKVVKIRRCLTRLRRIYTSVARPEGANYYTLLAGGVKEVVVRMGKRNVCRVKKENDHSNHPRVWDYIDNGRVQKFKCNTANYGGTRVNGKSFFKNGEWSNRNVVIIV